MIAKFRNYVFTGFLVVWPLIVSIFIVKWLFMLITNIVINVLPEELVSRPVSRAVLRMSVPIAFLALLLLIGIITKILLFRKILTLLESMIKRIPMFNKIYLTMKQISRALLDSGDTIFNRIVLFEYPRKGLYTFGFVTSKEKYEIHEKTKEDIMNVFIGTAPNPITGLLLFIPKGDTTGLKMSTMDGMKMIVTAGVVNPAKQNEEWQ